MENKFLQKGNAMPVIVVVVAILVVGFGVWYVINQDKNQNTNTNQVVSMNDDHVMDDDDSMVEDNSMTEDNNMADDTMMEDDVMEDSEMKSGSDTMMAGDSMMSDVVEIALNGFNFGYSQDEIRVQEGDTVKIVLTSTDGFHDWVVDEFGAATARVNTGETTSVEFVADQKGTFEFYCSVGQHRAMGMKGKLIVE